MTRVAVVGATGVVGGTMLQVLAEREFPADEIVLFASERSRGVEIDGRPVHVLDDDADLSGIDIALFSAGAGTSRAWAQPVRRGRRHGRRQLVGVPARPTRSRWSSPRSTRTRSRATTA